jgi:hypothetical protein
MPHGFVYVAASAAVPRRIVNDEFIAEGLRIMGGDLSTPRRKSSEVGFPSVEIADGKRAWGPIHHTFSNDNLLEEMEMPDVMFYNMWRTKTPEDRALRCSPGLLLHSSAGTQSFGWVQRTHTRDQLHKKTWLLFERHVHPPLYDSILRTAAQEGVQPRSIHHLMTAEEAAQELYGELRETASPCGHSITRN